MASENKTKAPPQGKNGEFIRLQYVVDFDVQGALIARLGLYTACFAAYFASIHVFTVTMEEPQIAFLDILFQFADEAIYTLPAVLLICPLAVYDMMKLSNRFAGPALVLRREMKNLIDRDPGEPASFRTGDFWQPMAEQFNQIRDELLELRAQNEQLTDQLEAAGMTAPSALPTVGTGAPAMGHVSQAPGLASAPMIAPMPGLLDSVTADHATDTDPTSSDAETEADQEDLIGTADEPQATADPSPENLPPQPIIDDEPESAMISAVADEPTVAESPAGQFANHEIDPEQLLAEIAAVPVAPVAQPETIGATSNPFAM